MKKTKLKRLLPFLFSVVLISLCFFPFSVSAADVSLSPCYYGFWGRKNPDAYMTNISYNNTQSFYSTDYTQAGMSLVFPVDSRSGYYSVDLYLSGTGAFKLKDNLFSGSVRVITNPQLLYVPTSTASGLGDSYRIYMTNYVGDDYCSVRDVPPMTFDINYDPSGNGSYLLHLVFDSSDLTYQGEYAGLLFFLDRVYFESQQYIILSSVTPSATLELADETAKIMNAIGNQTQQLINQSNKNKDEIINQLKEQTNYIGQILIGDGSIDREAVDALESRADHNAELNEELDSRVDSMITSTVTDPDTGTEITVNLNEGLFDQLLDSYSSYLSNFYATQIHHTEVFRGLIQRFVDFFPIHIFFVLVLGLVGIVLGRQHA